MFFRFGFIASVLIRVRKMRSQVKFIEILQFVVHIGTKIGCFMIVLQRKIFYEINSRLQEY
jgi:hypothetical protein